MPNRASRTKGWCKPMATVVPTSPEEMKEPPVKNLCERSAPQRRAQLHSRSQEQILHLILAKRPRRYARPPFAPLLVLATHPHSYGSNYYYIFSQLFLKEEASRTGPSVLKYARPAPPLDYQCPKGRLALPHTPFQHIFGLRNMHGRQAASSCSISGVWECTRWQYQISSSFQCGCWLVKGGIGGRAMSVCMGMLDGI